ncbi:ACTL9 protein, partial [Penelope pileata]|nr:ACTL9 protein [Penelope pileata]
LPPGQIVIDTGTRSCRAGFSGHQSPCAEISSLVGRSTAQSPHFKKARPGVFVGEEALLYPDMEVTEVMQNGLIASWEAAENVWQHLIEHELRVSPEEHMLLLTEPPFSSASSREKMAEVAFKALHISGLFVAPQPVLATYAHGRTSALVLDMGHAAMRAVPVLDGSNIAHGSQQTDMAGRCLTRYLATLLEDAGHTLITGMAQAVEDIKRTCCYVAIDFQREQLRAGTNTVDCPLPDGRSLILNKERFQCPELLFSPPPSWGESYVGIPELAQRSLEQLLASIRPRMCSNILLCGGSSLFRGLARRLCNELLGRLPPGTAMEVVSSPLRRYAAWTGGSVLALLRNFQSCWIRRDEYSEDRPCIVYQKCF